ncbi:MAG TPA: PBP1A family penicillin-binding protein [Candidatus Angelobacter sp.]|nr:PBP1A family penicillin-binding protein [Candidatus Angelobacter sp.]
MKFPFPDLPGFELAGRRVVGRVVVGLLVLTAALAGVLVGLIIVYSTDLPQIGELERYRPSTITELYDSRGRVIGQFALQRRVIDQYNDFPWVLREAIISTEDKNFESHWGINFWRVLGATVRDIEANRRAEGASTLTMQLSRNLFLSPERHFSRKVQEAMLAIQIERHFTKEQIFTMYANQIFLGSGVYGFEAGAEYYFSKHAKDLTLPEAALLAGLPKAPVALSPINSPEKALKRRNLVINNMLEDGKITREQANRAKASPLRLRLETETSPAPYFVEEVRRQLEKKYGSDQVHEGGLRVYTSLNLDLQRAAQKAMLDGLAAYERRHGWKGHLRNVVREGEKLDRWQDSDWQQPIAPGTYMHGLVVDVGLRTARIKLGRYSAQLGANEVRWTGAKLPGKILAVGDVVYVKVLALGVNNDQNAARVSLEQESGVQGALLAIDNATGDVKAMVGGRDFDESKFNRATQALRQTGSSFKPFVYTAAIDRGAEPDDKILDEPTTFDSNGTPYTPHNFDHRFEGAITLRHALADSRNVPAVKLAQQLGMPTVTEYARRFGITSPLPPYLPVALGAADLTLFEQTSAFTVFPNDGVRLEPRLITKVTDYDGHVLEEDYPEAKDVTSTRTARIMVQLLEDVVQHGTAIAAKKLKHPVAGKTGTTNDYTDAWFIGFSPSITCGVWVGYDEKKTLGRDETGAKAALPIWMDFMRVALADPARRQETFEPPPPGKRSVVRRAAVALPKATVASAPR